MTLEKNERRDLRITQSQERGKHERETQNSPALILFRVMCDREKLGQIQLGINNAVLNEWDFAAKRCMWIQ